MISEYENCNLCPRKCGVNRYKQQGFCGMGASPKAAKATLHQWEEPCISYKNGAGTVFFSGCSLRCIYCQNMNISTGFGAELTVKKLGEIYLRLQDLGADNIELVTPSHFLPDVIASLDKVKHLLKIPVIYNSGGYELTSSIKRLEGYIDVYLPDIKYYSSEISARYSNAPDYFEHASETVLEMIRQTKKLEFNDENGLIRGTVIRHLVLPSCRHDSIKILDWIAENTLPDQILISIMSQYTPFDFIPPEITELHRKVTKMEYNSIIRHAEKLGTKGFMQKKSSADKSYVPDFDLSGI